MIISMRPHATREEIDHVCERIAEFGYKVHSIEGEERVVIGDATTSRIMSALLQSGAPKSVGRFLFKQQVDDYG